MLAVGPRDIQMGWDAPIRKAIPMATQPDPSPDRIEPHSPPETPVTIPDPGPQPSPNEAPQINPDIVEPGTGPDELPTPL